MLIQAHKQSGFTIIELIIVLAVVAIFAMIALPNMSGSIIRSDLSQAQASVSQALRKAKVEARGRNNRISVTVANGSSSLTLTSNDGSLSQTVVIPNTVTVTSSDATYIFSPQGTVNALGTITLTSSRDSAQSRDVTIANLVGQITL